jgi:hypothetical protein
MRALLVSLALCASAATGCESILGVDFTAYHGGDGGGNQPDLGDGCSPLGANPCGAGKACLFNLTAAKFACQTSSGTAGAYGSCKVDGDCASGLACIQVGQNQISDHCAAYCTDNSGCETGHSCLMFKTVRKLPSGTAVGACGPLTTACDPSTPTSSCPASTRCSVIDNDYLTCLPVIDTRSVGATCQSDSDCAAGLICVTFQGGQVLCEQVCAVGGNGCGAQTCTSFSPTLSIGSVEVGFCQ